MNAVLFWKEYRQQRGLWFGMGLLVVVLLTGLAAAMNDRSGWRVAEDDPFLQSTLSAVLLSFAVLYGVAAGALLLAGEKDEGTLVFMDGLLGRREPLWGRKLLAGAGLTLGQSLLMVAFAAVLGIASWERAAILTVLALSGLAWGMLAGALARNVLLAATLGVVLAAASWAPMLLANVNFSIVAAELGVAGIATYASWRVFCRDDFTRQLAQRPFRNKVVSRLSGSWSIVPRLALRQGRWIIAGTVGSAFLLGCAASAEPLTLWPIGTALLGLVCGLAAFVPDQNGGNSFLSAQRFSLGRFWAGKTLCWFLVMVGSTALAWYVATGLVWFVLDAYFPHFVSNRNASEATTHLGEMGYWLSRWFGLTYLSGSPQHEVSLFDQLLPIGIWPLYGFCFGHFFGLVIRQAIVAIFLAVCASGLILVFWAPSLLFGGTAIWWALLIPGLLMLTSRLVMRPWASGRLFTFRPALALAMAVALVVICQIAFLWHRANEVPDIGEPFDVKAFTATLPPPEKNEAAKLLQRALEGMRQQRRSVNESRHWLDGNGRVNYWKVVQEGWRNEDRELDVYLDRLFQGNWLNEARTASRLPPGVLVNTWRASPDESMERLQADCNEMALSFVARALQLQARGDSRSALDHLETVLGLARQVRNKAPFYLYLTGSSMESSALTGFGHWFQKAGPDKELLQEAFAMLRRHESACPLPADSIKAQYLWERESGYMNLFVRYHDQKWLEAVLQEAYIVAPWEKERQDRLYRAVVARNLRIEEFLEQRLAKGESLLPFAGPAGTRSDSEADWEAVLQRLVPQLATPDWQECFRLFRSSCPGPDLWFVPLRQSARWRLRYLVALKIGVAAALYELDYGKPPSRLDDLAPVYLPVVPNDPVRGQPFDYRISGGEKLETKSGQQLTVAPGQALISAEHASIPLNIAVPLLGKNAK